MSRSLVRNRRPGAPAAAGFTLIEILVTLVIFALVMGAVTLVLMNSARSKQRTMQRIESAQGARAALDLIVRDVRSAGYGTDNDFNPAQPAIAYVDSQEIIVSENQQPFPDGAAGPGAPLAYDPNGSPKPRPLDATAWTPPTRYRTGAELIRYTLDVNNDGVVDANDIASPQGADAAATPNPNDYVLVRQVYGDSTSNVAGNEGGSQERIALVRKPGAGVPPMFTVYFRGSSTPWDWSNGPVPENQLANIQRVEVQVTATASRPDSRGQFAQTTLVSDVNSMRSVPDFGVTTFVVDGYVYNDQNQNHSRDAGEPGLNGVTVRLGTQYVAYTNPLGYFSFHVPNGTYVLKHLPPAGFGVETVPDSFIVTVNSAPVTASFADTARQGGWVHLHAYNDENSNGSQDAGEANLGGIQFSIIPGQPNAGVGYTDLNGNDSLFASAANYSVSCVPPDSMVVTTTNPMLGTMPNGGSASYNVGLNSQATGKVSGHVFRDLNRNGQYDSGELGLSNVWVGVSKDGGVTVSGYAYTDANGAYTALVPVNTPPHTTPYSVYVLPPSGYFPTGPTSIGGLWVGNGNNLQNNDFGMAGFQIITLNASRVLSLIATDLIEKDWNGNQTTKAHQDVDLILGADAGGIDNVDVWFNNFGGTSIFNATGNPDYTRLAPNSVLCMAADTLDSNDIKARPDIVTGTRYTTSGNFFVWFTQGSNNNEGYLPTTYNPGQNYRTSDNGDVTGVVTLDCAGGSQPDIVVGTKSPTAGQGQIEVWQSDDATTPTFTRVETFTNAAGWQIGEINDMILADLDNDGRKDLIVTARFSDYNGQLIVFQNVSKVTGARFVYRYGVSFGGNIPTAVAALDANGDGWRDLFVGTQRSSSQGMIYEFQNTGGSGVPFTFTIPKAINAPGIVATLCAGDFGGSVTRKDLACGWRATTSGFGGGVMIYFMDGGILPDNGTDPSGGTITNFVPALAAANFNFGLNTITPPTPYLTDLAVGIKSSSTTGALVVFIR